MTEPIRDEIRVAVAASFTAEPVEPALGFWATELGMRFDVVFAPYGQVFQELLGANSAMASNTHGVNVLLVRFADLTADGGPADLADAVRDAATRWAVPLVVVVCPSPAPADAEDRFLSALSGCPNVHVLGSADLERWYPGAVVTDAYTDRLGHVPYGPTAFTTIGTVISRRIYRILAPEPKVVVVDADHVLWDGVAGEGDIEIGPARQAVHDLLAAQSAAGRLLCLCSKNSEADTLAILTGHPDTHLRPTDFTSLRVNWRPKSANLRDIAAELNLGLDSFVFLDDSPVECAEIRERCPEAVVLRLPADATEAERFLRNTWILDVGATTSDDTRRAAHYRTERERDKVRAEAPTLRDFLDSLDLRVQVDPAEASDIPRIAQLTRRTNQFHLAPRVRDTAEVGELVRSGACLVVRAEDRFGSYGTVGVVVVEPAGSTLGVATFLLSCRVLGRGVEHRVLAHLGSLAQQRGADTVELAHRSTPRNQPAADFLRDVCRPPDDGRYTLSAADAAAARYEPSDTAPVTAPVRTPVADRRRSLWALGDRLGHEPAGPGEVREPTAGDAASIDETIAALMASVLGLDSVTADENFFELGGTSMGLIQLMSAVRDHFGVELPMDTLYNSELTAREISAAVLLQAIAEPGDVATALALVESMTDEQVEELLGRLASTPSPDID